MKKFLLPLLIIIAFVGGAGLVYFITVTRSAEVEKNETESLESIRPKSMRITDVGSNYFIVTWSTTKNISGFLKYGDTSNSISLIAQDVKGASTVRKHEVRVNNLLAGHKYYFWVMSDNIAFGKQGRALEVLTRVQ